MAAPKTMANYYMQGGDGKEYGPVSADQLRQWALEGRANAQTQVRATDGIGFVAFGTVPELTAPLPAPASTPVVNPQARIFTSVHGGEDSDATAQIKRLSAIVAAGSMWMKLLALTMFLLAIALFCTLVGILVCWLPLWQGFNLWGAANRAKEAVYTGSEPALTQALEKIRRSFSIGFFLILALTLFAIAYLAVAAVASSMGALQGLGGSSF